MARLMDQLAAVTTPVHVVQAILQNLKALPSATGIETVMSPDLSFIKQVAANTTQTDNRTQTLPNNGAVFVWNREALSREAGPLGGRVGGLNQTGAISQDRKTIMEGAYATFKMNWRFYASNMNTLEQFELLYLIRRGANSTRTITVANTNIGDFQYKLDWGPLTTLAYDQRAQFLMYLEGSTDVSGIFNATRPSGFDGTTGGGDIQAINSSDTVNNQVLSVVKVVPIDMAYAEYRTLNNL